MPLFTPEGQLFVDNTTGQLSFKLTKGPYKTLGPFSGASLNEARAPIIIKRIEGLERNLKIARDNVENWTKVLTSKRAQYTKHDISNIEARLAQEKANILTQDWQLKDLKEQLSGSEEPTIRVSPLPASLAARPPPASLAARHPPPASLTAANPQVNPLVRQARASAIDNLYTGIAERDPPPPPESRRGVPPPPPRAPPPPPESRRGVPPPPPRAPPQAPPQSRDVAAPPQAPPQSRDVAPPQAPNRRRSLSRVDLSPIAQQAAPPAANVSPLSQTLAPLYAAIAKGLGQSPAPGRSSAEQPSPSGPIPPFRAPTIFSARPVEARSLVKNSNQGTMPGRLPFTVGPSRSLPQKGYANIYRSKQTVPGFMRSTLSANAKKTLRGRRGGSMSKTKKVRH